MDASTPGPTTSPPRARLELEAARSVNFAMLQNGVTLVRRLAIVNEGDSALEDVAVRVWVEGFGDASVTRVARVGPGESYQVSGVEPPLDPAALRARTERERTLIRAALEPAPGASEPLARADRTVDVLAADEWGGATELPELLAAFVTPNHPALSRVLLDAARRLGAEGGSGGLDGYQARSPARARAIAGALFDALAERGLAYVHPPASFESAGQRIRSAGDVLGARLATCLDSAVLLASALEQAGLHPLVVLLEGHALAAFWTREETFPEPSVEDCLRVRKRVELGEIVVLEATGLTSGMAFDASVRAGSKALEDSSRFVYAVDVRAARKCGIRPLPQVVGRAEAGGAGVGEAAGESSMARAPGPTGRRVEAAEAGAREQAEAPESPADRVDRWKRKLLDLSLRNRLINLRATRRTLEIECPDAAALEDALAPGRALEILARPARVGRAGAEPVAGGGDRPDGATDAAQAEARAAFVRAELREGRLRSTLPAKETTDRLLETFRSWRTSVEESGANLLHLALGSLAWFEDGRAPRSSEPAAPRIAPLLLLPLSMERRSTREGFRIVRADEDARINVTLIEKLRAEFGIDTSGLAEVPEDESGVDVRAILDRFRACVKAIDGWEVRETAHLGLFSFSKFLMWLDLQDRGEAIRRSPTARRLLDRRGEGNAAAAPTAGACGDAPASLDDAPIAPLPLDADSSQLAAVEAAAAGRSFVLEGPPGTGKSQTIANIIARALGDGKRVLFVAEKAAALEVVRRRLDAVGLGAFCLDLHSSVAPKKDVLRQIEASLHAPRPRANDWTTLEREVRAARDAANAYVRAIHQPTACGESFHRAAARALTLAGAPKVRLDLAGVLAWTPDRVREARAGVERLTVGARGVAPVGRHALRGLGVSEWRASLPEDARAAIDALDRAGGALREAGEAMLRALACEADPDACPLSWLEAAAGLLACVPRATPVLAGATWNEASLRGWIGRARARDAERARLGARYAPAFLELDHASLAADLRRARLRAGPLRWWSARAARSTIRGTLAGDSLAPIDELIRDAEGGAMVVRESAALRDPACEPGVAFGSDWRAGEPDVEGVERLLSWCVAARAWIAARPPGCESACSTLVASATGTPDPALARTSAALARALDEFRHARAGIDRELQPDASAWPAADRPGFFADLRSITARWRCGLEDLDEWCAWRRARAASPAALAPLVASLEAGEVEVAALADAFERALAERLVSEAGDASPEVRSFTRETRDESVRRFATLDASSVEEARAHLAGRLVERAPAPPSGEGARADEEMALLLRQIRLQRRHLPTRRLIERLPTLLPRLKPCFLMSPLSVAQYLDPAHPAFDLVVFDEASQIPVWDAVGAIARGKETVVVGDSKQLPPTDFFQRIGAGEAEGDDDPATAEDDAVELESVLDECVACGLESRRLLWHYRSRHESLIAFSNRHYYEGRLLTFPAAGGAGDRLGVSLVHVEDGVYDRAGACTNQREGERVVRCVLDFVADESNAGRSLGVVTFSAAQQRLVEDMLDARRGESPALEARLADAREPLFVKNLENVQGDERDVMLFSIGYGPDAEGRLSMHFGPLNREGGERRLNVAITRARERVVVYSSILGERIDLSRTRARGVAHLRSFLEYARRGPGAIAQGDALEPPSRFEIEIGEALAERGHAIDRRVGCSGYRVDLAVRDPARPGAYLLGVECDGEFYRSAATARDRDRLRAQVLSSLGWRLHRVWCVEWLRSRARAIERIEKAIADAARARP